MHLTQTLLGCVAILSFMTPALGQTTAGTNSTQSSTTATFNPLGYIASNTLTAIAFSLILIIAFIQSFYTWRYGPKWMLTMVLGVYTYAIGFGFRFGLHAHPTSRGTYIAELLFIVLSPCAFVAADYVMLGRIARHISCTSHVLLPVNKLTLIFVSSDITTLCIQGVGGGMTTSQNTSAQQNGSHIFLAGLVLQLASFLLFFLLYLRFLYRVYTLEREAWERDKMLPWYRDWRTLTSALTVSCLGILLRCCYRVAQLAQGTRGTLATTEVYFYTLDTLPLLIAISVYVLFWPGWFIKEKTVVDSEVGMKRLSQSL